MVSSVEYLEVLYDALRSPFGTVVETSDPQRLRQRLYPLRKEHPEFEPLAFVISPVNGLDLWIVRKSQDEEE